MPSETLKKIPIPPKPKNENCPAVMSESKNGLPCYFPSFSANDKQMPEVDEWETEGRYRLVIDVVMTSKESNRHQATRGGFDIVAYKVLKTKTIDEMSDKEYGTHLGKELAKASK